MYSLELTRIINAFTGGTLGETFIFTAMHKVSLSGPCIETGCHLGLSEIGQGHISKRLCHSAVCMISVRHAR